MAGRARQLTLGTDSALPIWETVADVAATDISSELTLVGGLMVDVHAQSAGIEMTRPTDDVDVLVNYAINGGSLGQVRAALHSLGFSLNEDGRFAYRFEHTDGRKIDVMVADHLPRHVRPRLALKPAFVVPGGAQAIRRRDLWSIELDERTIHIGVPDELGALVAKGAAYLVDQRDRGRHLEDAAVLFAAISDATEIGLGSLTRNDKKRLRATTSELIDPTHPAWVGLSTSARVSGLFNVQLVAGIVW